MEDTMTTPTATVYVPGYQLGKLDRWIKRFDRWMKLCDALGAATEGTPEYAAALVAWRKGSMPSKASKHQAYSYADAVRRYLNERKGYSIERGSNVDYLRQVVGAGIAAGMPRK
jgi:hypothetical protein